MERIVRGIPIFYEEFGTGIPVIALHGFSLDHRSLTACLEPIFAEHEQEGWRRIYPDLPGMGQTPSSPQITSSDDILELILDFIEAVIPGENFLLAGESYGGYLAQAIVARKLGQVLGLGLICPLVVADHKRRNLPELTVVVKDADLLKDLTPEEVSEFTGITVVQEKTVFARFKKEILPGIEAADQDFLNKIEQNYPFSYDATKLSRPYHKPTLILLGRQDNIVGYKDAWPILDDYPRASFTVLDRAGHNLQIEQVSLFNALLAEWLERVVEAMM